MDRIFKDDDYGDFCGVAFDNDLHKPVIILDRRNPGLLRKLALEVPLGAELLYWWALGGDGNLSELEPLLAQLPERPFSHLPLESTTPAANEGIVKEGLTQVPGQGRAGSLGFLEISVQNKDQLVSSVMEQIFRDDNFDDFCSVYADGCLRRIVITLSPPNMHLMETVLWTMDWNQDMWHFCLVIRADMGHVHGEISPSLQAGAFLQ